MNRRDGGAGIVAGPMRLGLTAGLLACMGGAAIASGPVAPGLGPRTKPALGPNTLIFSPSMPSAEI
ncbi:MAG: hypothetical protein WCF30_15870 [Terracidiphilus sp.]